VVWGPRSFTVGAQSLLDDLPLYYESSPFMQQWLMALGFWFDILDRMTAFFIELAFFEAHLADDLPSDLEPITLVGL